MKTINLIIVFCLFAVTLFIGIYFGRYMGSDSDSDFAQAQIIQLEEEKTQLETEKRALMESLEKLQEEIAEVRMKEVAKKIPLEESAASSADMESIKRRIEELLVKKTSKFQDFTYLYNQVFEKPGWKELDLNTKQKFLAYYRISKILLNGNADAITKIMAPEHADIKQLSDEHRWQVLAIGYGIKDDDGIKKFGNSSVGKQLGKGDGINWFVKNRSRYKSFISLDVFKSNRNLAFDEL